jgi:hypothetical protein
MSIDLPTTEHATARELAIWCSDEQLARAIAYLELVYNKTIHPGPEIERLLGENSAASWGFEEVNAVQNRLALALCLKRGIKKEIRIGNEDSYPIFRIIRNCIDLKIQKILSSYNTR